MAKAREHDHMLEETWIKLSRGDNDAWASYEAAVARSEMLGFSYAPNVLSLARGPLLDRLVALEPHKDDLQAANALLGRVPAPGLLVSRWFEKVVDFSRDALWGKASVQRHRWELPRKRAIDNFLTAVGDREIQKITRQDALKFRTWWEDRKEAEGLKTNSANKDISHMQTMFQLLVDRLMLDLRNPFKGLMLTEDKEQGKPFSFEQLQGLITGCGGMNPEARAVVWGMIETGARPSELVNLAPDCIRLDVDIPHIEIKKREDRQVKTKNAERTIPLVGISLLAFRELVPSGFIRYRNKEASLSAATNKFMLAHELRDEERTLYSIRHSFQDRMIAVRVPERVQRDLFGHKLDHEKYGSGATLEEKRHWLDQMAIPLGDLPIGL